MAKSIIQNDRQCYICQQLGFDTPGTELHHMIHGVANRKCADEAGLTCYLCKYHHARLHDKSEWDKALQQQAQLKWMEYYEKTEEDFRSKFGKSYLT